MLTVKGMDVFYGHAQILHDISLNVKKGEIVFIIGRNGAGKTTLLKTVCGLVKPRRGSITFEDERIETLHPEDLAQKGIRYVAQDKKVFGPLTVRENLELASFAAREPLSNTIEMALNLYPPLEKFLDLPAGKLSGGQKEILLIARAITGKPKLLLIDEPTEGLASIVINDVYRLLEKLKGEVSAIIVEQNLDIVRKLANRIYIMKEGKIVKETTDTSNVDELEKHL